MLIQTIQTTVNTDNTCYTRQLQRNDDKSKANCMLIDDGKRSQFSLQFPMQSEFFLPMCILNAPDQATSQAAGQMFPKFPDKLQKLHYTLQFVS